MTPLTTPIIDFHYVGSTLTTPITTPNPTPSPVKTSLRNWFNYSETLFYRCSKGCERNNKRKRRDVTRDEIEHDESTTKVTLTRGPLIIQDEKQKSGGKFKNDLKEQKKLKNKFFC